MSPVRTRAFTLIEVLVSLAIFALAAVALAAAYLNILGAYQSVRQRHGDDEDWKFLRSHVVTEADRAVLERGGRLALPEGRQLNWTARIEPTEIADLFAVTVRAERPDAPAAGKPEAADRRILLLRPAWSEPGERDKLRAATQPRWEEAARR